MLLHLSNGSIVPLRAIARFDPLDRDGMRSVYDKDDTKLGRCSWSEVERAQSPGRLLPAQPGWLVVFYAGSHDDAFVHSTEPVIGWQIGADLPVPLVPSGMTGGHSGDAYFVLAPAESGASMLGYDEFGTYRDLEEGLRSAEERWRTAREAAQARAAKLGTTL